MSGPLSWDLSTATRICGGKLVGGAEVLVSGVVIDSRRVTAGSAFVALAGEHVDGHDFAEDAVERGAAAVIVEAGKGVDVEPRIEVGDTTGALLAMAESHREELTMPVIAITGSTGKTTTKDLLRAALGPGTASSPESYNNELGVPLTILTTPGDASFLVVEVGSRGAGHIRALAAAVRPDVAVITNLGLVHLETFGTPEALAAAKWELVEALQPEGTAVLPAGEARFPGRRAATVTFGDPPADVVVEDLEIDSAGRPSFRLVAGGDSVRMRTALAGAHQARNAAAAAAAASVVGVELREATAAMESAAGSRWRMEVHQGPWTVVNDSYNANPDSVESALRTVAAMPGRHIAVLGLMAELGDVSESEHRRIGRLAAALGFDPVIVVGPASALAEGAGAVAVVVADPREAVIAAREALAPGDVALVKGSRVAELESVADALVAEVAS
jgi:UDP-N-acetylmuramoyl-tripeptide--D-alanyl-D-alanine ligase